MHDLALFKDNFARAASEKVDLVDEIALERKAANNTWSEPSSTSTEVPKSSSQEPEQIPDVITEDQRSQIEQREVNSLFMEKNMVDVCLRRQFIYNMSKDKTYLQGFVADQLGWPSITIGDCFRVSPLVSPNFPPCITYEYQSDN